MLECVVKRQATPDANRIKIAIAGVTALIGVLTVFAPLLLPAFVISVIMTVQFFGKLRSVEYEYAFENANFSIDRIISGKKRKHCMNFNINQAETICPYGEFAASGEKLKVYDFASARPDARVYVVHLRQFGQNQEVIIEPDDAMLAAMKESAPELVRLCESIPY